MVACGDWFVVRDQLCRSRLTSPPQVLVSISFDVSSSITLSVVTSIGLLNIVCFG